MESCELILIGNCSEILPKVRNLLLVVRHYQICNRRKIGIPIVKESSFPVDKPYASSVEKNIVRLEHVIVTRHHIGVLRINCGYLRISGEELLRFRCRKYLRSSKLL